MKYFHTAISVSNMEKSRAFYEAVFDLKFRSESRRDELEARFLNLQDNDGNVVELFQHDNPQALSEDLMDFKKVGIKHLAFIVDNLEETLDKAVSHGAKVIWPIKKGITVKRIAFIGDPDGIPIELVELLDYQVAG